ncbi:hypothetical protein CBR_g19176 [Chara braunii]|uniref:Uncharacterized protein n=1 Tax=Chara braunii TaxID=69332 RepID=A0A388JTF6_CHABU|nr:hypothetical protein CBR_g19176 [Chara braunii]|eukprot:GBG61099.1 hypothetical protein CBR_g19176 [Chara braunii]
MGTLDPLPRKDGEGPADKERRTPRPCTVVWKTYEGRTFKTFFLTSVFDSARTDWVKEDKKVSLDLRLFQGYGVKAFSMKAFDVHEDETEFRMLSPEEFLSNTNANRVTGCLPVVDNSFRMSKPLVQFNSPMDLLPGVVKRYREDFSKLPLDQQADCVFLPFEAGSKSRRQTPSVRGGRDLAQGSSEATEFDDRLLHQRNVGRENFQGSAVALDEDNDEDEEGGSIGPHDDGGNEADVEVGDDNMQDRGALADEDADTPMHGHDISPADAVGAAIGQPSTSRGISLSQSRSKGGHDSHAMQGPKARKRTRETSPSASTHKRQARTDAVNEARSQRVRPQELQDSGDEGEGVDPRIPEDADEPVQRVAPIDTTRCFFLEYDDQGFATQDVHALHVDVMRIKRIPCGRILFNHCSLSENIVRGIKNAIKSSISTDPGAWDRPELVLAPVDHNDIVGDQGRRITPTEFLEKDPTEFDWYAVCGQHTVEAMKRLFRKGSPTVKVYGLNAYSKREVALLLLMKGKVVAMNVKVLPPRVNTECLLDIMRKERYMVRMFNYVLFRAEERADNKWNDAFFMSYKDLEDRYGPNGLCAAEWEKERDKLHVNKVKMVPRRLGGMEEARQGAGLGPTATMYKEAPVHLKVFIYTPIDKLDLLRAEVKRIGHSMRHIVWDKIGKQTTLLPVCMPSKEVLAAPDDIVAAAQKMTCTAAIVDIPSSNFSTAKAKVTETLKHYHGALTGAFETFVARCKILKFDLHKNQLMSKDYADLAKSGDGFNPVDSEEDSSRSDLELGDGKGGEGPGGGMVRSHDEGTVRSHERPVQVAAHSVGSMVAPMVGTGLPNMGICGPNDEDDIDMPGKASKLAPSDPISPGYCADPTTIYFLGGKHARTGEDK